MADLKPCPFCGGKPRVWADAYNEKEGVLFGTWRVNVSLGCNTCDIAFRRACHERNEIDAEGSKEAFIAGLTEQWNHRKSPPKKTKDDSHDRSRNGRTPL